MNFHTIKSKVNLSAGLVTISLVVMSLFSLYVIKQMAEFKGDITRYSAHQKEARLSYSLQVDVTNLWQFFTDASLTKDMTVIEKEAKPVFENARKTIGSLLEKNSKDAGHVKKLSAINENLGKVWEIGNRMVTAYGADWVAGNVVMDEYDKACDSLIRSVGEYVDEENKKSDTAVDEMFEMSSASTKITTIAAAVIVVICFGLFLIMMLLRRSILPLPKLAEDVALIASGDLQVKIAASGNDEVAQLSHSIRNMTEQLHATITQTSQMSTKVAIFANQIHSSSEQIAKDTEEVVAQTMTVATAGEEMAATSEDIARNCQRAAEGAQLAAQSAQNGAVVVDSTIAVMHQIAEKVKSSAKTVENLGERSEQIGAIIGTIEDIADQTNLLALNAAIEAARAGEQGRGFAVVADEVRALAERTSRATREIGEMIKAIQIETKEAVDAMSQGVRQVESGTLEAAKSGESLHEIMEKINDVSLQVSQIATAAEEQTATTGEISSNMQKITQVVHTTAQGAHESATASSQMNGNAEELMSVLGRFKIEENVELTLNKAKSAHLIFIGKIKSHLDGSARIDPNALPTHLTCAFGKWYQTKGNEACGKLSMFREIDAPHARVHDLGKQAINVFNAGDKIKASQLCEEMVSSSLVLLGILDQLAANCRDKH